MAYFATVMAASSATMIGINFNSGTGGGGTPDSAGAQAGHNTFGATWTDFIATSATDAGLNGTSGLATVSYTIGSGGSNYSRAGSWNNGPEQSGWNSGLTVFRNYLNDDGVTVTLDGLDAWLASEGMTGYTVTVYLNADGNNAVFHDVTIGGNALFVPRLGNGTWNGSIEDPAGNLTGGSRGQATTDVLTGDSVTISVPRWDNPTYPGPPISRGGLAAVVITAVPEPATTGLSALGMLMLLRRRRR